MVSSLQGELEAFRQFVGDKVDNGNSAPSLEQALEEFRAYQRDLERFKQDTRESLEQSGAANRNRSTLKRLWHRGDNASPRKG